MTSAASACPFCNAALPPLHAGPASRFTPCPRCGEPVPTDRFPRTTEPVTPPAISRAAAPGKGKTARTVLAIMAGMAILGLVFALLTKDIRRRRDPARRPDVAETLPRKPSELAGLAYLLPGTNVVAGLNVTALGRDPAGQALLQEPRPGPIARLLAPLELAGLTLADVDHVVVGCVLTDITPALTTVVYTKKPYDAERVRQAVEREPVRATTVHGKPLYRFGERPQVPKLYLPADRVLIYTTLRTEDVGRIARAAADPLHALTPPARRALTERVGKQSRLWAVGDLAPAKDLTDLLRQLGALPKEQARLLELVRVFAVGIHTPEHGEPTLLAEFYTGDAAATAELKKDLEGVRLKGAKSPKVEAPPPDIAAAEAQWVSWQVRADPAALRGAIDGLRLAPRKDKGVSGKEGS